MTTALRSLSNSDLLKSTKQVVAREHRITIEVLQHLCEVDRRTLYLELGHSSMFTYCTDELGYSVSAANRRISTARCLARFPEVLPLLITGEVNLSTVTQVARIMTPQNSVAILDRIRGKSQREVEAVVAEYEPLESMPKDRARTIVVRVSATPPLETLKSPVAVPDPVSAFVTSAQDRNGPQSEPPAPPVMRLERRVINQFSAREVVMNKIETVRALASHRLPMNAPLEQVIEFLADYFLKREDPKQRHDRRTAKGDPKPPATPKAADPRVMPIALRDEVFVAGQGECSFVGADGKRCRSKHVVQIDHINPVARNGSASIENLRLLCARHNRLEAERIMGRAGSPPHGRNGPNLNPQEELSWR